MRRFIYTGPALDGGGLPEIGHVEPGVVYELDPALDALKIAAMDARTDFAEPDSPAARSGDLPANFAGRKKLADAGLTTYEQLRSVNRDQLLAAGLTDEQADRALTAAGITPAPQE